MLTREETGKMLGIDDKIRGHLIELGEIDGNERIDLDVTKRDNTGSLYDIDATAVSLPDGEEKEFELVYDTNSDEVELR